MNLFQASVAQLRCIFIQNFILLTLVKYCPHTQGYRHKLSFLFKSIIDRSTLLQILFIFFYPKHIFLEKLDHYNFTVFGNRINIIQKITSRVLLSFFYCVYVTIVEMRTVKIPLRLLMRYTQLITKYIIIIVNEHWQHNTQFHCLSKPEYIES